MQSKECNRCGATKDVNEFHRKKGVRLNRQPMCKLCTKEYRSENSEKIKAYNRAWYLENRDISLSKNKEWRENNDRSKYVKEYYEFNRDRELSRSKIWRNKNKEYNRKRMSDWRNIKAKYETFESSLCDIERISRNNEGLLLVACRFCNRMFTPTNIQVQNRIRGINGSGGNNLYCSDKCKDSCSIFGKSMWPAYHSPEKTERPYQGEWSKVIIDNASGKCEICGKTDSVVAHHIFPVKTHPHLQADIDNGMCLCNNCHSNVHRGECSRYALSKIKCIPEDL